METQTKTEMIGGGSALAEGRRKELVRNVEGFLRAAIERLEPEPVGARHVGRPRIIPAMCLWSGLLVCVLHGFDSQLALWRLISSCGLWSYPRIGVSDQAVYKRLAQGGTQELERLFHWISALLRERLTPHSDNRLVSWAAEVFVLDATTLDRVARKLPALREVAVGDSRLLPGKLAGLFDIRRQQWWRVRYIEDPNENDKVVAAEMVAALSSGSLILADLGYFAFAWFDALTDQGYYWLSRLRNKTSYQVAHVFYQDNHVLDALVWLGAHRSDRAAHAVRLVKLQMGDKTYQYITNVVDPLRLTPLDIVQLYGRRWDIEMVFTQMTKGTLLAFRTRGDGIADFDVLTVDDNPVDEQFDQLPTLGKGQMFQSRLDALAEVLNPGSYEGQVKVFLRLSLQLTQLLLETLSGSLKFLSFALELVHGDNLSQISFEQTHLLASQLRQGLLERCTA